MMRYARTLEDSARWTLAMRVYEGLQQQFKDGARRVDCLIRVAQCCKHLNLLERSDRAYRRARRLAERSGDHVCALIATLGVATVATKQGSHRFALRLTLEALRRARILGSRAVLSRAWHAANTIAVYIGDFERAVLWAFRAYQFCRDDRERYRILNDLAAPLSELGLFEAAQDVCWLVATQSPEQFARWGAQLNLLDIASQQTNWADFEKLAGELHRENLTARMAAHFQINLGEGYQRSGATARASEHFRNATAICVEHDFEQLLPLIEAAKTGTLDRGASRPLRRKNAVDAVVRAIRKIRYASAAS